MAEPTNADIARDLRMFGRNLCTAREKIGPHQIDFATLAKSDRTKISRIECGRQAPKFATLLMLAHAANVKPAELFLGVGVVDASPETPDHGGATAHTPVARFGDNLKWARERAGLSQAKLASFAPADRSLLSDWETGKREAGLRTILKLARALEVPPALLLHDVESDQSSNGSH
jgi:transcriptional regulator with XRE-family HTH domain